MHPSPLSGTLATLVRFWGGGKRGARWRCRWERGVSRSVVWTQVTRRGAEAARRGRWSLHPRAGGGVYTCGRLLRCMWEPGKWLGTAAPPPACSRAAVRSAVTEGRDHSRPSVRPCRLSRCGGDHPARMPLAPAARPWARAPLRGQSPSSLSGRTTASRMLHVRSKSRRVTSHGKTVFFH